MAFGIRRKSAPSRLVISDVHSDSPCQECILCKNKHVYTHPLKWKNQSLFTYLRDIEPEMFIDATACICRNCKADLANGKKTLPITTHGGQLGLRVTHHVRYLIVKTPPPPPCRSTKLGTRELLSDLFNCQPQNMGEVKLCNKHYVELYKQLHPDHYKFNCMLCSVPIKASSSFRQCTAPAILQSHLEEHTGFTGVLTTKDKLRLACYRYNLLVTKKEKTITKAIPN